MVEARLLSSTTGKFLERQLIEVQLLHRFEGTYPDVPTSPDVDFEELVKPDREAGVEPFLVTLCLGYAGQESRNNRRYKNNIAPLAIYDAIWNRRITGKLGHTAEEKRSWEFQLPVLHWIGAKVVEEDGIPVIYGKAYIPLTAPELREYYRVQKAKRATVGTSLEGWGFQEFNEEDEIWEITELTVHSIDAVPPDSVGILKAGSMTPKITSETKQNVQEAAPDEVVVGDLVSWDNRNNQLMRGRINTIWTEGEIEVPYSDSPAIAATAENPLARMDVYEPHYKTGEWRLCGWQEIQYVRDLKKIQTLPELASPENTLSEGQEPDEQEVNIANLPEDNPMATNAKQEAQDVDSRIVELQEEHKEAVRKLSKEISELKAATRSYETMRKMLGIGDEANSDPVLVLQSLMTKTQTLEAENFDLLEAAIKQEVSETVKVEMLRPVIVEQVKGMKPALKADVKPMVEKVLDKPEIKQMLKYTVQQEMGPNVETQKTQQTDNPVAEQWIIIPGMEGAK